MKRESRIPYLDRLSKDVVREADLITHLPSRDWGLIADAEMIICNALLALKELRTTEEARYKSTGTYHILEGAKK